jgi:hypothetical protein
MVTVNESRVFVAPLAALRNLTNTTAPADPVDVAAREIAVVASAVAESIVVPDAMFAALYEGAETVDADAGAVTVIETS